jgi:hypothetical protein
MALSVRAAPPKFPRRDGRFSGESEWRRFVCFWLLGSGVLLKLSESKGAVVATVQKVSAQRCTSPEVMCDHIGLVEAQVTEESREHAPLDCE